MLKFINVYQCDFKGIGASRCKCTVPKYRYGLYVCIIIVPLFKKQTKQNKKQGGGEFQRCTVIKYRNQHWLRVIGVMPILFGTVFSQSLVHVNPLLWMMIVFSYDVMTMQRCEFNFLSRILISTASSYFFREF